MIESYQKYFCFLFQFASKCNSKSVENEKKKEKKETKINIRSAVRVIRNRGAHHLGCHPFPNNDNPENNRAEHQGHTSATPQKT